jgi:hypothetical protein
LSPVEFIRRFLQHRLPAGFVKIRHSGLLAPTNVNDRLCSAKQLLSQGASAGLAPQADDGDPEAPP